MDIFNWQILSYLPETHFNYNDISRLKVLEEGKWKMLVTGTQFQ